jgi:ribonuclease HI
MPENAAAGNCEMQQGLMQIQWQKPCGRWWKCNVDASISPTSNATGWGWVVHDTYGSFIAAGTNSCMQKLTAAEGEATALLEAMREAYAKGLTNIIFESDSKVVVDAIHANYQGTSELYSILSSIRALLHCNANFEVKFSRRQANMAAHTLARAAISWSRCCIFETLPLCITAYLNYDMI